MEQAVELYCKAVAPWVRSTGSQASAMTLTTGKPLAKVIMAGCSVILSNSRVADDCKAYALALSVQRQGVVMVFAVRGAQQIRKPRPRSQTPWLSMTRLRLTVGWKTRFLERAAATGFG